MALIILGGTTSAESAPFSVELIPDEVLFPPPMADPTTPISSLKYFHTSSDENYVTKVTAGSTFGLIRAAVGPALIQINGQGGIMGRLNLNHTVIAETTDFRIGIPIVIAWPSPDLGWIFEINPYHTSSHLNDDRIFENTKTSDSIYSSDELNLPINYTRDIIQWVTAYRFTEMNRIYASFSIVSKGKGLGSPSIFQAGSELFAPASDFYGYNIRPYLAENIRTKEETDWTVDLNLQAGIALNRPGQRHRMRLAVEYMIGSSAEGQLYKQKERNIGMSLSFDM
jgi:Protein of unknown function (DUF1207)